MSFSYSVTEALNLIKLVPLGKLIFNVGLLSGDIKTTLSFVTLIFSIAIKASEIFYPQRFFYFVISKISFLLKLFALKIKSTL